MKWRVPNLGEDLLGLVLPPGAVLCGDFEPSFSGRADNFIVSKDKTQAGRHLFYFHSRLLSLSCLAFLQKTIIISIFAAYPTFLSLVSNAKLKEQIPNRVWVATVRALEFGKLRLD
jgi:hypothetical protein